jgi:hypothetical protein
MQALLDSYTATEPLAGSESIVFRNYYTPAPAPLNTSIFVSVPKLPRGLNHRILKLLGEFNRLKDNWDEDDAKAPFTEAINKAAYIAKALEKRGQSIYHTAPGPNGEIMLDIRNNHQTKSLEIIFYQSRSVAVMFPQEGKPVQKEFDMSDLPEFLQWVNSK